MTGCPANDVQHGAQDALGPVHQRPGEAGVGEYVPDRGDQVHADQRGLGSVAVLDRGGHHAHDQQQSERVGDDEPLTPVDLLARVVAAGLAADGVGSLDALGVDDPRQGLLGPPLRGADSSPQYGEHLFGDLGFFPADEVPVHRLPGREVDRQLTPGASGADHVQDGVDGVAAGVLLWPSAGVGRGQQRFDQCPLCVGEIGGIAAFTRHPAMIATLDRHDARSRDRYQPFSNIHLGRPIFGGHSVGGATPRPGLESLDISPDEASLAAR